jgi:hypothetical protein
LSNPLPVPGFPCQKRIAQVSFYPEYRYDS